MENKNICKLCGYKWLKRTENPACCPKCKRYEWEGEGIKEPKK